MTKLSKILEIALIILLLILPLYADANQKSGDTMDSSNNYIAIVDNEKTLKIIDVNTQKIYKQTFDFKINKIDLAPSGSLISLVSSEQTGYIYHIKNDKLFNIGGTDIAEQRWSKNGRYVFLNNGIDFILIEIGKLSDYLSLNSDKNVFIKIKGHPLGVIAQEVWLYSDWMIYSTGVGESIAFGVIDIKNKKNYFLMGCGFAKTNDRELSDRCSSIDCGEKLTAILIDKIENQTLKKISFNFYEDVLKILNN